MVSDSKSAANERCRSCRHYTGAGECEAFPDGIIDTIRSGKEDHSKHVDGDRGFKFEGLNNDNE